ncbi:MAG: hypothetical protein IJH78_04015 [Clostridia bacterium]|nr:hypothetical protein [Clostridia bacterium]
MVIVLCALVVIAAVLVEKYEDRIRKHFGKKQCDTPEVKFDKQVRLFPDEDTFNAQVSRTANPVSPAPDSHAKPVSPAEMISASTTRHFKSGTMICRRYNGETYRGQRWEARFNGGIYIARIIHGTSEVHAVGYWRLDEEAFNSLTDENAEELIRSGRCIYTFSDIRSVGTIVRIFDPDWYYLCLWNERDKNWLHGGADFGVDYVNMRRFTINGIEKIDTRPDDFDVNVPFPG